MPKRDILDKGVGPVRQSEYLVAREARANGLLDPGDARPSDVSSVQSLPRMCIKK